MAENKDEKSLKAMQELTMLQQEDQAIAGKFNKSIQKFASIDTDDMLAALREMAGEDAPSEEELKKAVESAEE